MAHSLPLASASTPVRESILIADDTLIDIITMQKLLGYRSRGAVDRAEAQGVVPKSFRLGGGSRRWRLSAVRAAIKALEDAANANPLV